MDIGCLFSYCIAGVTMCVTVCAALSLEWCDSKRKNGASTDLRLVDVCVTSYLYETRSRTVNGPLHTNPWTFET